METLNVSTQHYLFTVQSIARFAMETEGDYYLQLRDTRTRDVIDDVVSGSSEVGIIMLSSAHPNLRGVINDAALEFTPVATTAPRIVLPANHPLANGKVLTLDELADYPYLYFDQGPAADCFAEEALFPHDCKRVISCSDRAAISELIVALNGYTISSGILVGRTDLPTLGTAPLESDVTLELGYLTKYGSEPTSAAQRFIDTFKDVLKSSVVLD